MRSYFFCGEGARSWELERYEALESRRIQFQVCREEGSKYAKRQGRSCANFCRNQDKPGRADTSATAFKGMQAKNGPLGPLSLNTQLVLPIT
jgi:hypothetical protein